MMDKMDQYEFLNKINQPLIFGLEDKVILNNQLEMIIEKINGHSDLLAKNDKTSIHNVFSIVGERGAGKTSLMESLRQELKKQKYYVFDMIDPSIFDDSLSISELLISKMYLEIKRLNLENDCKTIHIYSKMKELIKVLGNIKIDRGTFVRENPNAELLADTSNRSNFDEEMKKLLISYKEIIINNSKNVKYDRTKPLILCIDDIDITKNQVVYEILEDIRKFLKEEIIIILSYRKNQLYHSICDQEIKQNKRLIDYKVISIDDEINTRTFNYLEKSIPYSNQVELLTSQEVLNIPARTYFKCFGEDISEEDNSSEPLQDYIIKRIYKKTRIDISPIDFRERTKYNFPRNLRGINQLVYFLKYELEALPSNEDVQKNIADAIIKLIKNLEKYKNYIYRELQRHMNIDQAAIINKWLSVSAPAKNSQIYASLLQKIRNEKTLDGLKQDEILDINHIQPYNVALADAREMLETYKTIYADDEAEVYLIYSIKKLYSIELLMRYLQGVQGSLEENKNVFEPYLQILNAHIISQNLLKNSKVSPDFTLREKIDEDFIKNYVFTQQTARGDVAKSVRKTINTGNVASNRYRFHQYFYYNNDIKNLLRNGYYYEWNPFAKLAKSEYVKESLSEIKIKQFNKSPMPYIVYSMFDLDLLERINYSRQSESDTVGKFLNKINSVMNGDESSDRSNLKSEYYRLSQRIFGDEIKKESNEPFIDDNLKEKITEYIDVYGEDNKTENEENIKLNEMKTNSESYIAEIERKIGNKEYTLEDFRKIISNFNRENGIRLIEILKSIVQNEKTFDIPKKHRILMELVDINTDLKKPRKQFAKDKRESVIEIYEELLKIEDNQQPINQGGDLND